MLPLGQIAQTPAVVDDVWGRDLRRCRNRLALPDKLHMFAVGRSLHRSVCRTRMPASSPGLNDSTWTFWPLDFRRREVLSAAVRDEHWDQSALDRVFEAYRVSQQGFRAAFKDFHRLGKLYRLVRISIVNLFLELKAIDRATAQRNLGSEASGRVPRTSGSPR
jgi:hypothetical protein